MLCVNSTSHLDNAVITLNRAHQKISKGAGNLLFLHAYTTGGWPPHTSQVIIDFCHVTSGWLLKVIVDGHTNRRPLLGLLWSVPSWQLLNALCKSTRRHRTSTRVSWARSLRRTWVPSGPGVYFHSFLPCHS